MSQSFARGLKILDLFSVERPVLTIEEVADEINVSTITAYRYLKVLDEAGMLEMDDGEVRLSPEILRFANLFWNQNHLATIAKEPITELQQEINESIALCKLEVNKVVCIYRLESSSSLRSSFSIGEKMPLHAGAFARVIAAFLPERELKLLMNQISWTPFTSNTITNKEGFEKRIEHIREVGYDISKEEVNLGIVALGVPILVEGKVVAGLGISMPSVRYSESYASECIKKMKNTAQYISQEILNTRSYMI